MIFPRVLGVAFALGMIAAGPVAHAQATVARGDVQIVGGHLHVDTGFADRTFATAWGNVYYTSGIGLHAEGHYMSREDTAAFFAAGVSYNTERFSLKGVGGTSTDNELILPDAYARLEATFRTDAATGLVLTPSLTWRRYNAGIDEVAVEAQLSRYFTVADNSALIVSVLGRSTTVSLGDTTGPAFGAGVTWAVYRSYAVGVSVEGGRASYDALGGAGSVNDRYVSVRPTVTAFLNDRLEVIASGEYTDRESYKVTGGFLGLKLHLD